MSKKIHDILLGISVLPALLVMPAFAGAPDTTNNVFVLGDIVLTNQHVAVGEAAFAGRRMNNVDTNNRYQNVFPQSGSDQTENHNRRACRSEGWPWDPRSACR